ncbi:MAG: hypothetical protein GX754_04890 [Clostridiaceae bacterium]|nr:hypothetical protein [Clostridiaceae bacterium]
MKIISPYFRDGLWFKVNLHVHPAPVREETGYFVASIVREYVKAEYNCISLTGNNEVYVPDKNFNTCEFQEKIGIIPGFENTGFIPTIVVNSSKCENWKVTGKEDLQRLINEQIKRGGIVFFSQPMSYLDMDERVNLLLGLEGYLGIEVLNGNLLREGYKRSDGNNKYSHDHGGNELELWDRLLSRGKKAWGFGNDGLLKWGEFNSVFNLVKLRKNSPATPGRIIGALVVGSFVVSTGARIRDIVVENDTIRLTVENEFENKVYIAYGNEGRILKMCRTKESTFSYKPGGDEGYVRIQVIYESGKTLLTQPFFIGM